jgi:AraC-like DNA-binding protein
MATRAPSPAAALFTLPALRRARDLIDRDYAEPLNMDRIASEAGYTRSHFARSFTAAYGEPPSAYLTRRRLERAKALLRDANLTVTEVCMLVGFESLGSFSSTFTRMVGATPSAYRDRERAGAMTPPIPGCALMMWTRPHAAANRTVETAHPEKREPVDTD